MLIDRGKHGSYSSKKEIGLLFLSFSLILGFSEGTLQKTHKKSATIKSNVTVTFMSRLHICFKEILSKAVFAISISGSLNVISQR